VTEHKFFVFRFGDFKVSEREFLLVNATETVPVEPKAFRVLLFLLRNPGRLVSKDEILGAVWTDCSASDNSLTRSIATLRRLLGDDAREPRYIATVQTVGYRLLCNVEVLQDLDRNPDAPDTKSSLNGSRLVDTSMNPGALQSAADPPAQINGEAAAETRKEKQPKGAGSTFLRRRLWLLAAVCTGCILLFGLFGLLLHLLKPDGQSVGNYRYTPIVTDVTSTPIWSPDGKAIAYTAKINGTAQLFLRYLTSSVAIQLTHDTHDVGVIGWSSDRMHILFVELPNQLYSVATVGGEPEFVMNMNNECVVPSLSRDGKVLVSFTKSKSEVYGLAISDPLGSPYRTYSPAPFATRSYYNQPQLKISPDGKKILLLMDDANDKPESWLLPYPVGGNRSPRQLPQKLTAFAGTPSFSWMPDSRHIVVSMAADRNSPPHLWMDDTESAYLMPLTTGIASEWLPAVAPDGRSVLYIQGTTNFDVISLSLDGGSATTLITTGRQNTMATWSARLQRLVWVSNRNGPFEIWVRQPDGTERPAVTAADFPAGTTSAGFLSPAISPDGDRIIYERGDNSGNVRLWISSLSGGAPIRLTNVEPNGEWGGSWSPDGSRFVYTQSANGKNTLMTIRTSGISTPSKLVDLEKNEFIPDWSPAGDWITYRDDKGWHLISPAGRSSRFLGEIETSYLAFSKDGTLLYGIRTAQTALSGEDRALLFSLDPVTLRQRVIKDLGKNRIPATNFSPGIRFSLAPDGKSFVYSTGISRDDVWVLEGLHQPGWLDRARSWISN
jgi:Tol biopolymer transport system component/DNA-binding winged helix-turn-helix (wHTH) protein